MNRIPIFLIFSIIIGILLSQENIFSHNKKRIKSRIDSTAMHKEPPHFDYFQPEPEVIFKPIIVTPESLKHEPLPVKVIVIIKNDTLGTSHFERVLYSSNKRFNDVAIKYALQYRFKMDRTKLKPQYITIPMSFTK